MSVIEELIEQAGFDCVGTCEASKVAVHEEVRDMCAAGRCPIYGTNWACPPACGDIYDFEQQIHAFDTCAVVQTVANLEDEFDAETMMEAQESQVARFRGLMDAIDDAGLSREVMMLSAGTCQICKECAYPDAPCRFPDKRLVSMEAAGLNVSEVCTKANIPYNHGPLTIAYSCCVMYNES